MNELVKSNNFIISNYDELEKTAKALAASKYFTDLDTVSKAITKILAGQEFGFGPFASVNGIHIIQGKPAIGANLMAAAVKRSGKYNYRVIKLDDTVCEIKFYENGEEIGTSTFTVEDARKAGTKNLDKFPRNMLFARAISNGVRWFCPDALNGSSVYTPEELGAEVDSEGNVVSIDEAEVIDDVTVDAVFEEAEPKVKTELEPERKIQVPQDDFMTLEEACTITDSKGRSYGELSAEALSYMSSSIGKALKNPNLSPEEKAEYQRKFKAIGILLKAKSEGVIE